MPANTGSVKIEIQVDDKGTVKVKQFGDQMDKTGRKGERSFKRTGRSIGDFNNKLTATYGTLLKWNAILMAATVSMGYLIKKSLDAADAIGKTADKLGISTAALQEYRFAASQTGVVQTTLDMALQRFIRRFGEAAQGTGELKSTLEQYNIAIKDSSGRTRSAERVLEDLADVIARTEDKSEQLRIAFKAFDSEGAALVNMLKGGSLAMNTLRQEARDLGIVMSDELIRNAETANDALDKLTKILKVQLTEAIIQLAPQITKLANALIEFGKKWKSIFGTETEKAKARMEWINKQIKFFEELLAKEDGKQSWWSKLRHGDYLIGIKRLQEELDELNKKIEKIEGPIKLNVRGPGQLIQAMPDMWAEGWAKAEEEVAKTWQQSAYGFNQLQEHLVDAEMDSWQKKTEMSKRFTEQRLEIERERNKKQVDDLNDIIWKEEEIYKNFIRNMQNEFADTFYDIFSGQLDSFDDFLDSMKKSFLRMLAEMAAAAAMKKIVIPMAANMGSASGLFGATQGTGTGTQMPSWVGTLGTYGMAAYAGWTIGQMIGKWLGLGPKGENAYYRFGEGWRTTAEYTPGQGFDAISNIEHHGGGKEITDAVRQLYEQMVNQANAVLKSVPMKLQDDLEPYLESIVFRPTDYKFKFKNAEQVIQAMAEKWTAQVEEAFNKAARATGNASFAEMLAWEDISWQASVAGGAVSDLEVQIHNINEQFDAWIQQLTQLGSTEERLGEIEKYRQMALDGLTTSTANYARQIEGLQATLLNLTTGSDSPLDAMERLALAKKAIGSAMGPDMTPEDVNKIQSLWMNYLRIAQEAYQRPSLEYQNIYAETTAALNSLVGWLQGMETYQHGTDYVPVTGPAILHRGERVSRPGEGANVVVNFQPSIQVDGSRDSMRASREITGEFERFMRGRGRKIVQDAVKYQ